MSYFVTYAGSKKIVVTNEEKEVLKITYNYNWLKQRLYYQVYIEGLFILEFFFSDSIFSRLMGITQKKTNKIIEFKKVHRRYLLNYAGNNYYYRKNYKGSISTFFKNPIYTLLKNDIAVGEIDILKKIAIGTELLFKITFYEEDESNLFQAMFFITSDHRANR